MQQPVAYPYAEPHHWSKSAQYTVSLAALGPVTCVWIPGCSGICFWLPPGFQTRENGVRHITLTDVKLVKLSPKQLDQKVIKLWQKGLGCVKIRRASSTCFLDCLKPGRMNIFFSFCSAHNSTQYQKLKWLRILSNNSVITDTGRFVSTWIQLQG